MLLSTIASLLMACNIINVQPDIASLINKTLENHVDYLESFEVKCHSTPYYIDLSTFPQNYELPTPLKERGVLMVDGTKRKNFREEKHTICLRMIDIQQDSISIRIASFLKMTKRGTIYAGLYSITETVWAKDPGIGGYKLISITH